jgi:hypothetical protein
MNNGSKGVIKRTDPSILKKKACDKQKKKRSSIQKQSLATFVYGTID